MKPEKLGTSLGSRLDDVVIIACARLLMQGITAVRRDVSCRGNARSARLMGRTLTSYVRRERGVPTCTRRMPNGWIFTALRQTDLSHDIDGRVYD